MTDQKTEQKTDEQRQLEAQAMQRLQLERLRDEFAMAALQGMLADTQVRQSWQDFAKDSYELADAMLAARTQEPRHD